MFKSPLTGLGPDGRRGLGHRVTRPYTIQSSISRVRMGRVRDIFNPWVCCAESICVFSMVRFALTASLMFLGLLTL